MQATTVVCPRCGKGLRLAQPLPAGRRIGCPHCANSFAPGEAAPAAAGGGDWWSSAAPPAAQAALADGGAAEQPGKDGGKGDGSGGRRTFGGDTVRLNDRHDVPPPVEDPDRKAQEQRQAEAARLVAEGEKALADKRYDEALA